MSVSFNSSARHADQHHTPSPVDNSEQITRQANLRLQSECAYRKALECLENIFSTFSKIEIARFDRHLEFLSIPDLDRAARKISELLKSKEIAHRSCKDRFWNCSAQVNELMLLCQVASVDVVGYSIGKFLLGDTFLGQAVRTCFLIDFCLTGIIGVKTSAHFLGNKIRVGLSHFNLSVYREFTELLCDSVYHQRRHRLIQSLSSQPASPDGHSASASGPIAQLTLNQQSAFSIPSVVPRLPRFSESDDELEEPIASTNTLSELKRELQQATRDRDLARSSELKCQLELQESQALVRVLQNQLAHTSEGFQSRIGSLYQRCFCRGNQNNTPQNPESISLDTLAKGKAPISRGQMSLEKLTA